MNAQEGRRGAGGGILRSLRPGHGAEAGTLRRVHGLPGLQRRSALQDHAQADPETAAEGAAAAGRELPQMRLQLVLRNGQYGEFVSCSGYPKCKYIKQNLIEGMKCPKCGDGDIAERKARRGNLFYGCTNYPKCDFTSNAKPVPEKCPECGSPYLLEKTRTAGTYLVCPNNRKSAAEDEAPKKRAKKGAAAEQSGQSRWSAPTRGKLPSPRWNLLRPCATRPRQRHFQSLESCQTVSLLALPGCEAERTTPRRLFHLFDRMEPT